MIFFFVMCKNHTVNFLQYKCLFQMKRRQQQQQQKPTLNPLKLRLPNESMWLIVKRTTTTTKNKNELHGGRLNDMGIIDDQ
ncbi:hypothetical protein DERP_008024 [Dermatophagoides pteronyssinus]|uniref:Uncharacterized protein n=1 Tax=Dermatophagoides pteronyssinus TaxID=6956 RepID=A0ABQ8ITL0_DERPT|nr:hypothetical protein DERP_008024 [Dermatophagoides pteronyssinus]